MAAPFNSPSPLTSAVQLECGASKPPDGTAIVNRRDDPDIVPDIDPRPLSFVAVSVIVIDPVNEPPDCVSCHVIWPGPDESDAFPTQAPVSPEPDEGDGLPGEAEPPPPSLQADQASVMSRMMAGDFDRSGLNVMADRYGRGRHRSPTIAAARRPLRVRSISPCNRAETSEG